MKHMSGRFMALLALALLLAGCAKPLPPQRLDYAGLWQGKGMVLQISADGYVSYKRMHGSTSTSINAPLKEFVDHGFVVGVGFMTTTFDVTQPPHQENGVWVMEVDGVQLQRHSSLAGSGAGLHI